MAELRFPTSLTGKTVIFHNVGRKEHLLRVFGEKFSPSENAMHGGKTSFSLFLGSFLPTCAVWNCCSSLATMRKAWWNTLSMVGQKHRKVLCPETTELLTPVWSILYNWPSYLRHFYLEFLLLAAERKHFDENKQAWPHGWALFCADF